MVLVYQQIAYFLISWVEIELADRSKPDGSVVVLKLDGKVYGISWFDDERAKIMIQNTSVLSERIKEWNGVTIDVVFNPDDPEARRKELAGRKTHLDQWHMYDLTPE